MKPTEQEYKSALEVVKTYERNKEEEFKQKVEDAKVDLDGFFKTTEIKSYVINFEKIGAIHKAFIIPTEPQFDEDYDGQFDKDIATIATKHDIKIKMHSGLYSK